MSELDEQKEFAALWELYKIYKKKGVRNAAMLADIMDSDASFYMTKEIWRELIEILREFDKFQRQEKPTETRAAEESWIFWDHYRNLRDGLGVTESKQSIAAYYGYSFARVDKVIQRKYVATLEEKQEQFDSAYDDLRGE